MRGTTLLLGAALAWWGASRLRRPPNPLALGRRDPAYGEFMSEFAHEVRNVLGSITVSTEVLRTGAGGALAGQSALVILARQTERLGALIDSAVDVARAMDGQLHLARHDLNLGEFLKELMRRRDEPVRMSPHSAHDAWISADPARIGQALHVLLAYVSTHTVHDDGACLTLETRPGEIVLRIAGGMSSALQLPDVPQVELDSLRLGPGAPQRGRGGQGVDVMLAGQLLHLHGGSLRTEAAEGGITFVVHLPALEALASLTQMRANTACRDVGLRPRH